MHPVFRLSAIPRMGARSSRSVIQPQQSASLVHGSYPVLGVGGVDLVLVARKSPQHLRVARTPVPPSAFGFCFARRCAFQIGSTIQGASMSGMRSLERAPSLLASASR
jgi:hypothetical protein